MTNLFPNTSRFLLSATAAGLAMISLAGPASASPTVTASASLRVGAHVEVRDHRTPRVEVRDHRTPTRVEWRNRYQPRETRPVFMDPYHRALVRYDVNHNRHIDAAERKGFWTYMVSTGAYGQLSSDETSRFIQLVRYYDLDTDGRLLGSERAGMDRMVDSLRLFKRLDRNRDKVLSPYEVGWSMFAPRFYFIDANRDRVVSMQEVRNEALRAFRDGECG